jgi:hypothetical protein
MSDNTLKIKVSTTTQKNDRVEHEGLSWKNEEKLDWG